MISKCQKHLTELPMACCCWFSCLGIAGGLAGPLSWMLGAGGRGCDWADMTPKLPLVDSLGTGGTPLEEDTQYGFTLISVVILFNF